MKTTRCPLIVTLAAASLAAAHAATFTWTGGGADDSWATSANWAESPTAAPVSTDDVVFYQSGASRLSTSNIGGASLTINSIAFSSDASSPVTITADPNVTRRLTIMAGGIAVQAGNHKFVGDNLGTNTNTSFRFGSGSPTPIHIAADSSFEINARVGHSNTATQYTKTGAGTLILSGNSGGTGAWQFNLGFFRISEGLVRWTSNGTFGNSGNKWEVKPGAALEISGGASSGIGAGTITLEGTGISGTGAIRSLSGTNAITLNASGTGGIVLAADSTIGVDDGTLTIGAPVTGAFNLSKTGLGTLSLSGASTFTGSVRVAQGTLNLANANALATSTLDLHTDDAGTVTFGNLSAASLGNLGGSRPLNLTNNNSAAVTLTVGANNQSSTYSGNLGGLGTLVKTGTGTLTLDSANSFAGGTTVTIGIASGDNSGAIHLAHPQALGSASTVHLNGGGGGVSRLELSGGHSFNSASITTRGRPSPAGVGAVLLNASGNNTWNGNITMTLGGGSYGIRSEQDTLTINGGLFNEVTGVTSRDWDIYGAGNTTITGNIKSNNEVPLGLRKFGTGTLKLLAPTEFTGATTVIAGTLALGPAANLAASSLIHVQAGSTLDLSELAAPYPVAASQILRGSGSITGDLSVSGTVQPGSAVGTLSVDGAVTFVAGSKVEAELGDQINASGALNISGAALELSGTPPTPQLYILASYGSLVGTFASVTGLPPGYTIDYNHDDSSVIALVPPEGGNYQSWAADNAGSEEPGGDYDEDGIPNLVEYALNLNPSGSDGSPGSFASNTISFAKRAIAVSNGDLTYSIQTSSTLAPDSWTTVTPTTNDTSTISYTLPSDSGRIFARLVVTQN